MKRYLVFYGWVYYPEGGIDDFIGDFEDLNEAVSCIEERLKQETEMTESWDYLFGHIWDSQTRVKVWENGKFINSETIDVVSEQYHLLPGQVVNK